MELTKFEKGQILTALKREKCYTDAQLYSLMARETAGDKAAGREMDKFSNEFDRRCEVLKKRKTEARGDKSLGALLKRTTLSTKETLASIAGKMGEPYAAFMCRAKSSFDAEQMRLILKSGKPLTESQALEVYSRSKNYIGESLSAFEITKRYLLQERSLVQSAVKFCRELGCRIA